METTLKSPTNVPKCKDILLRKLSYAVTCSVITQLFTLFLFLFAVNFDLLEPLYFIKATVKTFTSASTWFYIVPFSSMVFAQSIVCAKDYILIANYHSTRMHRFLALVSLRNLVLLCLYVLIGGTMVWLFLTLGGGQYSSFLQAGCGKANDENCLVEGTLFLILSGLLTGLYYFCKVHIVAKRLMFPVIHQRKLIQLKFSFVGLVRESRASATWPTLYFCSLHWLLGDHIRLSVIDFFGLPEAYIAMNGYAIYGYAWLFTFLYFVSMNLMRFYFELFLTEPIEFPLADASLADNLCLADAINFCTIPVVQHLACLDFQMLTRWSRPRRQLLFSLSQPGGHPHAWNFLIQNALRLITTYCECLNKATTMLSRLHQDPVVPPTSAPHIIQRDNLDDIATSPLSPRFRNIRNMSAVECEYDRIDISRADGNYVKSKLDDLNEYVKAKVRNSITTARKRLGIDYMFGELPEAHIQYCLGNAQLIIWTTEGLASLAAASLTEDRFGIVQKDLPVIITTLVELKSSLERLQRVPTVNRRHIFDDFNGRMKGAIDGSVKRSLFNICHTFERYLKDLPLSKEVMLHLQMFVAQKNC